jgi:hypothetical protein
LSYINSRSDADFAKFQADTKLPLAGYRYFDSAASVYDQGYLGIYWSSSPIGPYAYILYFDPSHVDARGNNNRANALSLRCFQDS